MVNQYRSTFLMVFVLNAKRGNIMDTYEERIIIIEGMPCIVLEPNTLGPPIPTDGPEEYPMKDFTQLQFEKTQKFLKELLDEIKTHGYIFY